MASRYVRGNERIWYKGIFGHHVEPAQVALSRGADDGQTKLVTNCHAIKAKIDPAPIACQIICIVELYD